MTLTTGPTSRHRLLYRPLERVCAGKAIMVSETPRREGLLLLEMRLRLYAESLIRFSISSAHRASADTRTHCSSGTHRADGTLSSESEVPAWEDEDVPEDLVPNRTDLAAGPRQALTDRLDGMGICRPNLRLWGR